MQKFRTIIQLFAIVGVLFHAGLIVRHSVSMVLAKLQYQELVASLSVICHSGGAIKSLAAAELPDLPEPTGQSSDCPLCMGTAAVAILPIGYGTISGPDSTYARISVRGRRIATRLSAVCPPPRGPPGIA
mgnify:CR=1 FL=1